MPVRPGARLIQALLGWAALGALPLLARAWAPALAMPVLLAWALLGALLAFWALDDLRRLRDEAAVEGICLVVGMHDSPDEEISDLSDSLLFDLGQAIENTNDSSNDMWA
ncbi:MAG: hypothetical protein CL543_06935, partial [Alcanivorax sp.]|nr:hypothetical protein [Alcanivorax sp.]